MPLSMIARHRIAQTAAAVLNLQASVDPLLGAEFSALHSRLGSALKRDGHILADVLTETLDRSPFITLWSRPRIMVSQHADMLAGAGYDACENVDLPLRDNLGRPVCPDIVLVDHRTGRAAAYEVKRGAGHADAGKQRSTIRDLLAVRMQLAAWVRRQGYQSDHTVARVVYVYGTPELHRIDPRLALFRRDFDVHFGIDVNAVLEETRALFRDLLLADRDQLLGHGA